jgi:hypothetical protein
MGRWPARWMAGAAVCHERSVTVDVGRYHGQQIDRGRKRPPTPLRLHRLAPEGMAETSQDLPAAEVADAGVLPCSSAFVVRSDI